MITLATSEEKNLKNAFEEFLRVKRINNIASETIRFYDSDCRYFFDYAGESTNCRDITNNTVLGYIEHLRNTRSDTLSDISINTYLRAIRAFLYFCMEQGYTPKFNIYLIKASKPMKETYTDTELEKLLVKPNIKKCSFSEYRNWVLVCYLLGTGNRRKTVCNVKIGDVDFEAHEIRLKMVKNKKQYSIPLSAFLDKVLREYLVYRKGNADDYLFCNVYGQKLTEEGLKSGIRRHNETRGVLRSGLHLFRHTFAKKWIWNRGDPFRLKSILGHSSMAMTNEYVDMFGKDLQKDFDTYSPLDNMECIKRSKGHIRM